jgi:hypothetical protein
MTTETKKLLETFSTKTKYIVSVCRIAYAHNEIEVEADSPEQAEEKALDKAGDYLYNEHTSEYEVTGVHTDDDED